MVRKRKVEGVGSMDRKRFEDMSIDQLRKTIVLLDRRRHYLSYLLEVKLKEA